MIEHFEDNSNYLAWVLENKQKFTPYVDAYQSTIYTRSLALENPQCVEEYKLQLIKYKLGYKND